MLEAAYYYGMTPDVAKSLTCAEMVSFINARSKAKADEYKVFARMMYSCSLVASMALQKTRPKFEDLFRFEDTPQTREQRDARSRAQMLVWAEEMNRLNRNMEKQDGRRS